MPDLSRYSLTLLKDYVALCCVVCTGGKKAETIHLKVLTLFLLKNKSSTQTLSNFENEMLIISHTAYNNTHSQGVMLILE